MKYFLTLLTILVVIRPVYGQSPPGAIINDPKGVDESCIYKRKYSEAVRLKFYPFNISDKIMLVSFRNDENKYPIGQHHVSYDSLLENRVLSKAEIGQLTDILYNNVAKNHGNIGYLNMCFEPHNAILFVDKTGRLREYLLICFLCDRYVASSYHIKLWDPCNQKIEMIRSFFVSAGIKYGTNSTME
jgi:hypothetical protein